MTHSAQRLSLVEPHDMMPSLVLGDVIVLETSHIVQSKRVDRGMFDRWLQRL